MNYKLLTPGPLTTSKGVKEAMLTDHCTWDDDYKDITQNIRSQLLELADVSDEEYTVVLLQGSGSYCVESVLGSALSPTDKLLICSNGAYGQRMIKMAERYAIPYTAYEVAENAIPDVKELRKILDQDSSITALAMVHSETTSGILNELDEVADLAKEFDLLFIVDAMSSFGGIPIPVKKLGIHYLISSANKCIQGVPGFAFAICQKEALLRSKGNARTVSLDLYEQYETMNQDGKWRFTSPTHTVLAFEQALKELDEEGGIEARYQRYAENNRIIRVELEKLGFSCYVTEHQGPFITSFLYPENSAFNFPTFYTFLKERGYAIYPGKISEIDSFRIGNIGEIYPEDMYEVASLIKEYMGRN